MYNFQCAGLAMLDMKVLIHPCYKVILESTFDELVE